MGGFDCFSRGVNVTLTNMKFFSDILFEEVNRIDSRLCIGLDIDADRITSMVSPTLHNLKNYTCKIIENTLEFAACYKLNLAFYEKYGSAGYAWLEEVINFIDGQRLIIADGKRGDIANSARQYASALFQHFGFDAATVNPYMGHDAISPFLETPEKGVFVICLTSNKGAMDIQFQQVNGQKIYRKVIDMVKRLNVYKNCGLVVGATRGKELEEVRKSSGNLPFLIPGIGAQGGDLETSVQIGNRGGIALINVSRGILYAGDQSEKAIIQAARDYCSRINMALRG